MRKVKAKVIVAGNNSISFIYLYEYKSTEFTKVEIKKQRTKKLKQNFKIFNF